MIDLNNHLSKRQKHLFFDEWTYSDLLKKASLFFPLLKDENEFVALKMQSPFLSFAAQLAVMASGKKAVLISSLETESGIEQLRKQTPFEKVFTDHSFIEGSSKTISFPQFSEKQIVTVVFSSGSSGTPKGIALSFGNIFYSVKGFEEFFHQTSDEVSLMNLPHHHVGGLMTLWRAFLTGGSLISKPSKNYHYLSVVPLQLARALENEELLDQYKACKVVLVGGAKLSTELREKARQRGLELYETYGMSETTSVVCINGEVLPYREIKLDTEGSIYIKGKTLSPGEYRQGQFYSRALDAEGWFKTQDVGIQKNHHIIFSHRSDLIFISGGENINPLQIEDVLREHPQIKDAYVLPVEDERWGQMGIVLYDSDFSLDEKDLKNFLKLKLHPHHIPKKFFKAKLQLEGRLKPKRSDLQKDATASYLHSIFSHHYIQHENAPLIVFLHGFTGSKEDFFSLGKSLRNQYSQLYIDLPGHGETKADEFFSTTDVLKKLAAFIRLFSPKPIYYGYSMGGRVALQLALNYLAPEKLILESAGPGLKSIEEAKERQQKDLSLFDSFATTKDFLLHWYANDLFGNYRTSPDFNTDIEKKSLHDLAEWKKSQATLSQGSFPLLAENSTRIKKASFPIYYLYGSKDLKYQAYNDIYPHAVEIEGAFHNIHKGHLPEITAFLNSIL